jgi:hypothetical protein
VRDNDLGVNLDRGNSGLLLALDGLGVDLVRERLLSPGIT